MAFEGDPKAASTRESALERIPRALPGAPAFAEDLRSRLADALAAREPGVPARTRHVRSDGTPLYTNRLLLESSPYLQQHAHNPVNWFPWGEDAFAEAKRLDRPIFLSIGYSTCHWCHVMEDESFDDPDIARTVNEHFIAIKVDREVRPDVDAVYMSAVQAMTGSGGWPLSVWLTQDGKPFYGGTYFPPRDHGARPGFATVLRAIQEHHAQERPRLQEIGDQLADLIKRDLEGSVATATRIPSEDVLRQAAAAFSRHADRIRGGLLGRMKFPATFPVRFMLRFHHRTGDRDALELATLTLEKMAAGGIHDQIGGGFHRYSTDPNWLVPHFEKMLYDNALLAAAYLEGWRATGREDFARVAHETLRYVAREMTSEEGAFYSATDADSPNADGVAEEGWFFTWTPREIELAVGPEHAACVNALYGVTPEGNHEGRNVLHCARAPEAVARECGMETERLHEVLATARARLYEARAQRPAPLRDEKILVAWNGLMISAFAQAGFFLGEPRYVEVAQHAADFLLRRMVSEGRLARVFKDGRASGPAFLEDYAFLIAALIDLYETDADPRWLRAARELQETLDRHYLDSAGGGYFNNADDQEALLAREKPNRDGATPCGNSVAARNLLRLGELSDDARYAHRAAALLSWLYERLAAAPTELSEMLLAVDFQLETVKQIVLIRPASGDNAEEMLARLRSTYLPNRVLVVASEGEDLDALAATIPLVSGKRTLGGRVTAHVCENKTCKLPTDDPDRFSEQLRARSGRG